MNLAITRTDGGVSIMSLSPGADVTEELNKYKQIFKDYVGYRILLDEHIPTDDTYRDAWKDVDGTVLQIDLTKAKTIHLDLVRKARAPLFEQITSDMEKAQDANDQVTIDALKNKRQFLRDYTENLKKLSFTSLDEIKNAASLDMLKEMK